MWCMKPGFLEEAPAETGSEGGWGSHTWRLEVKRGFCEQIRAAGETGTHFLLMKTQFLQNVLLELA